MTAARTGEPVVVSEEAPAATGPERGSVPASGQEVEPRPPSGDPLLAICALCGGAGASTLAYLVARAAARSPERPVLVCDTGGPTGGLAAYAGVASPRSLPRAANAIAAHEPLGDGLFAGDGNALRVIASGPHLDADADEDGVARLLRDARQAHRLTVVDCGTLRGRTDRQVLAAATHVAWVLPASSSGVRRGERVLELFGVDRSRREVVVARRNDSRRKPPVAELGALAAARDAPLVLMPHVSDLAEHGPERAFEVAALTLDAIQTVLRR